MAAEAKDESRMLLWEHLAELRSGLVRALIALSIGLLVTYNYSEAIVQYLESPLLKILPANERALYYTGIADKFFIYLKVSVIAAAMLVSPYLMFEIWRFVSPGLYRNEKRFVVPFVTFGSGAFITGIAFAFYVVIPAGYKFLIEFGSPTERPIITLTEYFGLTLKLMLALGLIFELPIAFVLLGKMGIVDVGIMTKFRRHAFVGSAVVAAVATPTPDAFTMLLVMIPLYALYEVSIIAVRLVGTPREPSEPSDAAPTPA